MPIEWNNMKRSASQMNQNFETCLKLMKNADYILLHFTDMLGFLKGRTIPAEEAESV